MRFILSALIVLFAQCSFAQDFNQAVQLLNQNKREEAKAALKKIPATDADYLNAQLGLTILNIDNGAFDEAFTAFNQFVQSHPNPYPYIYALWDKGLFSYDNVTGSSSALQTFMKNLMNNTKAPVSLRAMATNSTANRLFSQTNIKEAKQLFDQLGDVRNWATVGEFENISASGFNKDFGVLAHPENDYVFKNNIGAPVKWFNIDDSRADRWLDLVYNYDISNSIVYTQTFLQTDADKDVTMLLGVSGSVKVWINDYLVATESEERNTDLDLYAYKVKLQKGTNRILIQIGASEITRSNFLLRFADNAGNLFTGYKTSQTYSPYTKAQAYEVQKIPFFAEQYFEDKIAHNTATFFDRLLLSGVYGRNEKKYEGRKIAEQIKKEAPKSTIVSEAIIEAYSRDNDNTDLTREVEFIKTNDPESLIGIALLHEDAMKKEDYEEADKLVKKRIAMYGSNEETEMQIINILAQKKDYESLLKEADKAYKQYPGSATFTKMQYNIAQNVNKDVAKATVILENYLKTHYNESITETVINDKMKIGKKAEGFKLYNDLLSAKPYATGWYNRMAGKYYDMQDYTQAAKYEEEAIKRAPYLGSFYNTKGLIYDAAGKKTEAVECFKKAVQYSPNDYDARRKLRELEGKKDLFTNFKQNNIDSIYKNSPKPAAYPNDNSIYLLKDMQQVIYPENGASEEKNQVVVKILNQAGIDVWKEVSIPYNSYTQRLVITKSEILKKDGSKVQAESNDNQIVFSSLEVGDAIHIDYKLETSSYGKLSEHFWEEFDFNGSYPTKIARYNLLVPGNRKFEFKMYNSTLKPTITDMADGYKMYNWEKQDNPRIEQESLMPAYSDIAEKVVISSIPDWNYVANWYSDLSNVKVKADFEIKQTIKELLQGKEKLSEIERAKVIYDYIEANLNYSNVPFLHSALTPQRASRTLNSRLGDCKDLAVLFTSMAKEAGLNANLVLVDTRDEGDKNLDLPMIGFNHCIAQLHTSNGKMYLIELTDNQLPFGAMPVTLINATGLYIPKDGGQTTNASLVKLNTENRILNTIERTSTLSFNGTSVTVDRVYKKTGAETSTTRNNYRNLSEEDSRKSIIKALSSEFATPVTLKNFTISNLDTLSDSIIVKYNAVITNYTTEIASMQIVKLPWSDAFGSMDFVSLDKRTHPLNIWEYTTTPFDRETMTIMFPQGKKLVEVPQNVNIACPGLSYNLTYTVKPDRLIVKREVKYLKEIISIEEYDDFKNVVSKLIEADKKQLAFK
ncbi:DUF3857 domain-containing protein [Chitinophagaceae bacterium LWZ2-11]